MKFNWVVCDKKEAWCWPEEPVGGFERFEAAWQQGRELLWGMNAARGHDTGLMLVVYPSSGKGISRKDDWRDAQWGVFFGDREEDN